MLTALPRARMRTMCRLIAGSRYAEQLTGFGTRVAARARLRPSASLHWRPLKPDRATGPTLDFGDLRERVDVPRAAVARADRHRGRRGGPWGDSTRTGGG